MRFRTFKTAEATVASANDAYGHPIEGGIPLADYNGQRVEVLGLSSLGPTGFYEVRAPDGTVFDAEEAELS